MDHSPLNEKSPFIVGMDHSPLPAPSKVLTTPPNKQKDDIRISIDSDEKPPCDSSTSLSSSQPNYTPVHSNSSTVTHDALPLVSPQASRNACGHGSCCNTVCIANYVIAFLTALPTAFNAFVAASKTKADPDDYFIEVFSKDWDIILKSFWYLTCALTVNILISHEFVPSTKKALTQYFGSVREFFSWKSFIGFWTGNNYGESPFWKRGKKDGFFALAAIFCGLEAAIASAMVADDSFKWLSNNMSGSTFQKVLSGFLRYIVADSFTFLIYFASRFIGVKRSLDRLFNYDRWDQQHIVDQLYRVKPSHIDAINQRLRDYKALLPNNGNASLNDDATLCGVLVEIGHYLEMHPEALQDESNWDIFLKIITKVAQVVLVVAVICAYPTFTQKFLDGFAMLYSPSISWPMYAKELFGIPAGVASYLLYGLSAWDLPSTLMHTYRFLQLQYDFIPAVVGCFATVIASSTFSGYIALTAAMFVFNYFGSFGMQRVGEAVVHKENHIDPIPAEDSKWAKVFIGSAQLGGGIVNMVASLRQTVTYKFVDSDITDFCNIRSKVSRPTTTLSSESIASLRGISIFNRKGCGSRQTLPVDDMDERAVPLMTYSAPRSDDGLKPSAPPPSP